MTTSRAGSRPGSPTPRSAAYYVSRYTREDPGDAVELGARHRRLGRARAGGHPRRGRHRRRGAPLEPHAATGRDRRGRGHRAPGARERRRRGRRRGRGMTDDRHPRRRTRGASRPSATSCCARSTISTPSSSPATSIPTPTACCTTTTPRARRPSSGRSPTAWSGDSPDGPRCRAVLRALTIGGIVVFAVLAAILLAHTVGQRQPGQQITGDAQSSGTPTTVSATQAIAAAKAGGRGPAQELRRADQLRPRAALGRSSTRPRSRSTSRRAKLDPTQAEPLAYTGWLTGARSRRARPTRRRRQALLDAAAEESRPGDHGRSDLP